MNTPPRRPARSSRQQYQEFVEAFRTKQLDSEGQAGGPPGAAKSAARRAHLREYLRWLRPHRTMAVAVFLLALIGAGLQMVEPLFLRYIIDRVLLVPTYTTAEKALRLHLAGATFLTVIIVSNVLGVIKDYRQRMLNTHVMLSLRRALFRRFLHLPLPRLWDMKTGGILSRLTGDVDTTTGLLQMAIMSPSLSVIRLLVAIGILLSLNWRLALMAIALIPGAVYISFASAKRIRPIYRSVRKDAERIDGRVGETFSGIRVVRAFGRERTELLAYMRGRHGVLRKELFASRRELFLWSAWGLMVGMVNVVIVWFGGALNLAGTASIGDIMAFQWYTFLLLNPVWSIVNSFSELQRSLAAMERVFDVLAMPEDKPDRVGAVKAPTTVEEIRVEQIGFAYREGVPVLHDVSVTVPGGSVVALVGRSGAGKTTLTDLIARFHDPTSGRILLNGTDIRDFTLRSYRQLLGLVQQDVFLFDGSVRENIAYARPDATEAAILDAARRANAHEFIERLPEGYDTYVGERGVKLSGGQQQRLAIARAILAAPQMLILDEATSNLDTESEQLIQAALEELLVGRTTFVIAHRLSTIRNANLILLFENGAIIERGTHESLMAAGGAYAEMVQRQMQAAEIEGASLT
ncbi:MAG: ABC transporter ATP-binding protein [Gemmatimonadaceae bacterium]